MWQESLPLAGIDVFAGGLDFFFGARVFFFYSHYVRVQERRLSGLGYAGLGELTTIISPSRFRGIINI